MHSASDREVETQITGVHSVTVKSPSQYIASGILEKANGSGLRDMEDLGSNMRGTRVQAPVTLRTVITQMGKTQTVGENTTTMSNLWRRLSAALGRASSRTPSQRPPSPSAASTQP